MNELEQATSEELIEELQKRFAATLVVTIGPPTDDREDFSVSYSGGLTTAVGMANRVCDRLKVIGGQLEPVEDDDGEAA